jgi:hypothetical protein
LICHFISTLLLLDIYGIDCIINVTCCDIINSRLYYGLFVSGTACMHARLPVLLFLRVFFLFSGSLVMEHLGETSNPFQGTVLYGSVTGAIGKYIMYIFINVVLGNEAR